jgi:hypothetical protein
MEMLLEDLVDALAIVELMVLVPEGTTLVDISLPQIDCRIMCDEER